MFRDRSDKASRMVEPFEPLIVSAQLLRNGRTIYSRPVEAASSLAASRLDKQPPFHGMKRRERVRSTGSM
jgi:hypothetical protein